MVLLHMSVLVERMTHENSSFSNSLNSDSHGLLINSFNIVLAWFQSYKKVKYKGAKGVKHPLKIKSIRDFHC